MTDETRKLLHDIMDGQCPIKSYNPNTGKTEFRYVRYNEDSNELEGIQNIINTSKDIINRISPAYPFLDSVAILYSAKNEMDHLKQNGADNYYHRLAMCNLGQNANYNPFYAVYGLLGGIGKEFYDIGKKSVWGDMLFRNSLADSAKDMKNNLEGLTWGLKNPEKDCREWLKDLDWKTNEWKK